MHGIPDIACGGKRKEESLSTGMWPDHALFVKHMEMRGDFLSRRSVKQTEEQNPKGRKEKGRRRVTHRRVSHGYKKKGEKINT